MLNIDAISAQANQPQEDEPIPHGARFDSFWAQGLREVRLPERVLCYHLAADLAEARRRRRTLPETDSKRHRLRAYARFLQCRLSVLSPAPDQTDEIRFHFATLKKSLETAGPDNPRNQKHAARLLELIPGGTPEDLIGGMADRLAREAFVKVGILSYSPELYYLFRNQGKDLELTKEAMGKLQADNLLFSLNSDLLTWDSLETTSRAPVYCHPIMPSGFRFWIELDQLGFWIFARSISGCSMLNLPFPCIEEAQYYIEGSLTADLMAGAFLGSHWNRQSSE